MESKGLMFMNFCQHVALQYGLWCMISALGFPGLRMSKVEFKYHIKLHN